MPYIVERRVPDCPGKTRKLSVHDFQFWSDTEHYLYPLLLGHLYIGQADLAYIVDNIHRSHYQFPVYGVPLGGEGHSKGVCRRPA